MHAVNNTFLSMCISYVSAFLFNLNISFSRSRTVPNSLWCPKDPEVYELPDKQWIRAENKHTLCEVGGDIQQQSTKDS